MQRLQYELRGKDGPTVLGVETPKTLFRRGLLHSSVVAHVLSLKFSLLCVVAVLGCVR